MAADQLAALGKAEQVDSGRRRLREANVIVQRAELGKLDAGKICFLNHRSKPLEGSSVFQDLCSLVRDLFILDFRSRVMVEVVAAEVGAVSGGDSDLGMHVLHGELLESNRISEHKTTLIGNLLALGLRGRVAAEVVAAKQSCISSLDTNFGMQEVEITLMAAADFGDKQAVLDQSNSMISGVITVMQRMYLGRKGNAKNLLKFSSLKNNEVEGIQTFVTW